VSAMRAGLVHDYLLVMRGAERTFAAIAACWPEAPIYALLHDPNGTGHRFADRTITTSYLQRSGFGRQDRFRRLLPLFPHAIGRLPVHSHDLVISSSSAFAHGVRASPDAIHISYCHSPFRYAWHERENAIREMPPVARPALRAVLAGIRAWDRSVSQRVSHYIANSEISRQRIAEFWGRDSSVVHPPVQVERFSPGTAEDFFLVVGEISRHKRVEAALEAALRAKVPIKVVGTGPDLERLRALYGSSAAFVGRVTDSELASLYARARAVVVPGVEEFGIVAVEAQAAGRPVVAADAGGARETVVNGETGVLVPAFDARALAEALRETDFDRFRPVRIRQHAERFSTAAFTERLLAEVARFTGARPGGYENQTATVPST
jgi:glycosyltransferase involved in cell wall biosynthesis